MTTKELTDKRQWVFSFDKGGGLRSLLGGKGADLAEMTSLGLPVPPGFTISTEACRAYYRGGNELAEGVWEQVRIAMADLERATSRKLGDPYNPMLVAVRSGAAVSMPGMMDTILNLGINERVAEGLAQRTGNERFALDVYRRFVQMYAKVVLGMEGSRFERAMEERQRIAGVDGSGGLSPQDLREMTAEFQRMLKATTGAEIPEDPLVQLRQSIVAVFDSWNSRRAIDYRNFHGISHDHGTAVNVVAMVYGNMDDNSCTGVCFTRDPGSGEKKLYGEYLVNAQGEDVVSGAITPRDIAHLSDEMPKVYKDLTEATKVLERHYRDVQDVEFTVEQGKLYMLQTRSAKRSAKAAVVTAVDMVEEGIITKSEALLRVAPDQIYQLLLPRLDEMAEEQARTEGRLLTSGLGASPGGATGKLAFDADTAERWGREGIQVILARPETSPEDVHGMLAAAGILTSRGGTTSHSAVVARGLGKPCVTGAERIEVNPDEGYLRCGEVIAREGDEISIDGDSGEVFTGPIATIEPHISQESEMVKLLGWADDVKRLGVWANADYPRDVQTALEFGAEGVGLCRTEHMFFEPERLALVRQMILNAQAWTQQPEDSDLERMYQEALEHLERFQTRDFEEIFRAMDGRPVVIRLLDPPLHEFLPSYEDLLEEVVELRVRGDNPEVLVEKETLLAALNDMREVNPMLGLRGCRLGLKYPGIYAMQARAIVAAASSVGREGVIVHLEIMVPLVGHGNEMMQVRQLLEKTIEQYFQESGTSVDYKIGTMIEVPRAALTADEIAKTAEFFSFGTNDLTQTTLGYSRDDAESKFLQGYLESGTIPEDPFKILDREGVGELIRTACKLGKQTRPDVGLGLCGEHGGDPSSIEFCHEVGLDYVSCSPYRVPVARLAAAQAALRDNAAS